MMLPGVLGEDKMRWLPSGRANTITIPCFALYRSAMHGCICDRVIALTNQSGKKAGREAEVSVGFTDSFLLLEVVSLSYPSPPYCITPAAFPFLDHFSLSLVRVPEIVIMQPL